MSLPTRRAPSTFPPFFNFNSTDEELARVTPLTSSISCTNIFVFDLNTFNLGHSAVPEIQGERHCLHPILPHCQIRLLPH